MTRAPALLALAVLLAGCDDASQSEPDPRPPQVAEKVDAARGTLDRARQEMRAHFLGPDSEVCTPTWRAGSLRERAREIDAALASGSNDPRAARRADQRAGELLSDIRAIDAVAGDLPDWTRRAAEARRELGRIVHALDARFEAAATRTPDNIDQLRARRDALLAHFRRINPHWRSVREIADQSPPRDCLGLAESVRAIESELEAAKAALDATREFLDTLD